MSYTQLVSYSVVPVLMIIGGLAAGDILILLAIGGGIIEAFIIAKFFDKRGKPPPSDTPLPPNVFKKN